MSLRFLDSSVLLYAYSKTPSEASKRNAARAVLAQGAWAISAQVLQEFYANATRARAGAVVMLAPEVAAAVVAQLQVRTQTAIDAALVTQAIAISQRHRISCWDAAIVAAAARCGAKELLTEDLNAGQVIEGVAVVNPFA
jgi:predicted nucleic acid-binding protein